MRKILAHYPGIETRHLLIGEGGVFARPTAVSTVLGSCVAVTFHCRLKKIGGIFHAIMPRLPEKEKQNPVIERFKYVDSAIESIVRSLYRRGIKQRQIEAKVFGGANAMFRGENNPGRTNIRVALETLAAHRIKVVASDVGGANGRNLVFISSTGEVYVKPHNKNGG